MKKVLCLALALMMSVSLCACGGDVSDKNGDISDKNSEEISLVKENLQGVWKQVSTNMVDFNETLSDNVGAISASVETKIVFAEDEVAVSGCLHVVDAGFNVNIIDGADAIGTYTVEEDRIVLNWENKSIFYDDFISLIPDELAYGFEDEKLYINSETLYGLEHSEFAMEEKVDKVKEYITDNSFYITLPLSNYYTLLDYYFQDDGIVTVTYQVRGKSENTYSVLMTRAGKYNISNANETIDIEWFYFDPIEYKDQFNPTDEIWYSYNDGSVNLLYAGIPMKD